MLFNYHPKNHIELNIYNNFFSSKSDFQWTIRIFCEQEKKDIYVF